MKKKILLLTVVVLSAVLFAVVGCSPEVSRYIGYDEYIDILPETVPLTAQPSNSPFRIPMPVASGTNVERASRAEIDFSNAADGYVMIRFTAQTDRDVQVVINCPMGIQYQYHLDTGGEWEVFPLTGGNGAYRVRIAERVAVGETRFSVVASVSLDVVLADEFAPFLRPNQFVNFHPRSQAVTLAAELLRGSRNELESVGRIYTFVTENIEYDFELAATVRSGYVPDIDAVLESGKGICFDYAALMTAMLRSQGIPTKLVIGYVGNLRHAWISVHTQDDGWINNIIWFDGEDWHIMDPTFTAAGATEFTGTGENHNPTHFH